jgi:hypothetical protein
MIPKLAEALNVGVQALFLMDQSDPQKHRGPSSRFEKLLEEVSKLPRRKQQIIADVVEALITKETP